MVNICESALKTVKRNKRKWLSRLGQSGNGGGNCAYGYNAIVTYDAVGNRHGSAPKSDFDPSTVRMLAINCWDNAPTESWFNSFKNERYHRLRYATHDEMKAASFEYIEVFYNRKRQHSSLGYRSPTKHLERWTSEQNQEKCAA